MLGFPMKADNVLVVELRGISLWIILVGTCCKLRKCARECGLRRYQGPMRFVGVPVSR